MAASNDGGAGWHHAHVGLDSSPARQIPAISVTHANCAVRSAVEPSSVSSSQIPQPFSRSCSNAWLAIVEAQGVTASFREVTAFLGCPIPTERGTQFFLLL